MFVLLLLAVHRELPCHYLLTTSCLIRRSRRITPTYLVAAHIDLVLCIVRSSSVDLAEPVLFRSWCGAQTVLAASRNSQASVAGLSSSLLLLCPEMVRPIG